MNALSLFAAISGNTLMYAVIWVLVAALIFGLLNWLIDYLEVKEPFRKIARAILAIVAVVVLINALLTLVGNPFIRM